MNIDRERDALIVVDVQNDFMPGGALAVERGNEIVPDIAELMREFNTVIATQDWHPRNHISFASVNKMPAFATLSLYGHGQMVWPDHCIQGTKGAALHADLPTEPVTMILRKGMSWRADSYSAFKENWGPDGKRADTGLAGFLFARGIRGVVIVGLARDVCCLYTAQDAAIGFDTRVVWDLTRSVRPSQDETTRHAYLSNGVRVI